MFATLGGPTLFSSRRELKFRSRNDLPTDVNGSCKGKKEERQKEIEVYMSRVSKTNLGALDSPD